MALSIKPGSQPSAETVPDIADFAKETDFGGTAEATEVDKQGSQDLRAAVSALYDAFAHGDRAAFEAMIADDFRFTSPYDDAIDRAEFFERCWPNHEKMAELAVQRISLDGAGAYVTYDVVFHDGHRAQNTEWLTFRDGKVKSVDVYFGASHASLRDESDDQHERRDPNAAPSNVMKYPRG